MKQEEIALASALERCKMRPNTATYRFVKAMCRQAKVNPAYELMPSQVNRLEVLRMRYARQIEKLQCRDGA